MQKCYNKPNRSRPRYFSSCDAARIARQVTQDDPEVTPEEVLACIAKGFGFSHISLSRLSVVESVSLSKIPIKPILTILEKLLIKLATTSTRMKRILGPLLIILKKALDLADKIDTIEPPQKEVDDVINKNKCNCIKKFHYPALETDKHGNTIKRRA